MTVLSVQNPLTPQLHLHHYVHHHLPHKGSSQFYPVNISLNSSKFQLKNYPSVILRCYRCYRSSINANVTNASSASDADSSSPADIKGSLEVEEHKSPQRASISSNEYLLHTLALT